MVAAAETDRTQPLLALRDAAIISLILGAGLRRSEVCGLTVADAAAWDPECGWELRPLWRIIGKGDKERQVSPSEEARDLVQAYLDVRPELRADPEQTSTALEGPGPLFVSRKGGRLDGSTVYRLWRRAAELAGQEQARNPRAGRHSHATRLYELGRDLYQIAEQLGHEDLETTRIYTHVSAAAKRRLVEDL